jgi:hypothetical protein
MEGSIEEEDRSRNECVIDVGDLQRVQAACIIISFFGSLSDW